MKIGILSQDIGLYSTRRLYNVSVDRGNETQVVSYLRCYMNIAKSRPRIFAIGEELHFDAIIPRIAASWTFYGAAVVRQFELKGTFTANSSASISRARDKLRALQVMGNSGVEMPVTGYVHFARDIRSVLETIGEPPFVIKSLEGTQGRGVVLTETYEAAVGAIEAMKRLDLNILVQEFIGEAEGEDIRAIVVGNRVVASMKRKAKPGDFRANIHLGGSSTQYTLTPEEEKTAITAVKVLGLSVAGVDMIQSSRGTLVIEVNSSPGLEGIEGTSEVDVASEIINFIEEKSKKESKSRKLEI